MRLVRELVRHVLPQVLKPLRALWNELVGFVFLVLALMPVPRLVRDWQAFRDSGEGELRILLSLAFVVVMGFFGVQSFLRARKISRS